MRITLRCIEEQITDTGTSDMLLLLGDICEENAVGDFLACPLNGSLPEIGFTEVWEAQEPEDSFGKLGENSKPSTKCGGLNLINMSVYMLQMK